LTNFTEWLLAVENARINEVQRKFESW
jgi:hypothetical protein